VAPRASTRAIAARAGFSQGRVYFIFTLFRKIGESSIERIPIINHAAGDAFRFGHEASSNQLAKLGLTKTDVTRGLVV